MSDRPKWFSHTVASVGVLFLLLVMGVPAAKPVRAAGPLCPAVEAEFPITGLDYRNSSWVMRSLPRGGGIPRTTVLQPEQENGSVGTESFRVAWEKCR